MPRYFLEIAYNGTAYHGWQKQDNAHSVQTELESAICTLNGLPEIETTGCGRTDTGVHAVQFFLHFDIEQLRFPEEEFVSRMNKILPRDISVYAIHALAPDAHSRYDAISRTYQYFIHQFKNPFLNERSWHYHSELDVEAMNKCAKLLLQFEDFASFCKSGSSNGTTICKITRAEWERRDDKLIFTISADRFLRNMVRAVVGTLIQVGRKQITEEQFIEVIESRNRSDAGESVPACGLYLSQVTYPYIRSTKR